MKKNCPLLFFTFAHSRSYTSQILTWTSMMHADLPPDLHLQVRKIRNIKVWKNDLQLIIAAAVKELKYLLKIYLPLMVMVVRIVSTSLNASLHCLLFTVFGRIFCKFLTLMTVAMTKMLRHRCSHVNIMATQLSFTCMPSQSM